MRRPASAVVKWYCTDPAGGRGEVAAGEPDSHRFVPLKVIEVGGAFSFLDEVEVFGAVVVVEDCPIR